MGGKPVGGVFGMLSCAVLAACAGCHACSNSCDYLPPVADGPYTVPGQRAGSAFGGPVYHGPTRNGPLPEVAEEQSAEITQTLDELLCWEGEAPAEPAR